MENLIPISYLNDFIFCPRSIYFHNLYGQVDGSLYQTDTQLNGLAVHEAVDNKTYSSRKTIYQSIDVYSSQYGLYGKIDTYDAKKKEIRERKKKIKTIYDGYIFQVYAHYYCLVEMGHEVESIKLYSYDDNKNYKVLLPTEDLGMKRKFETLLADMRTYKLSLNHRSNINKCNRCIYNNLCDFSLC